MEQQQFNTKVIQAKTNPDSLPDYNGNGIAIWLRKSQNGKQYAFVKLFGTVEVYAYENMQKKVQQVQQPQQYQQNQSW